MDPKYSTSQTANEITDAEVAVPVNTDAAVAVPVVTDVAVSEGDHVCYVLYNTQNRTTYIGYSVDAVRRLRQHNC